MSNELIDSGSIVMNASKYLMNQRQQKKDATEKSEVVALLTEILAELKTQRELNEQLKRIMDSLPVS